ncbi:AAA family ATPase [Formosa sp. A9]|uniref:AAA family ATPase n=1 Tax=Formosa sp. A9 TaxID=3442641 RepID=UPI003EBBF362
METELKQEQSDCVKVVLFGPESTGKTVLAKQLATHYNTLFVPEFSRIYAEKKLEANQLLSENDVLPIAKGQILLENTFAKQAEKVLICDTDLLETKVYAEAYYKGFSDVALTKYASENTYHLYLLTYIDVPWEADKVRDKPNDRETMFNAFKSALNQYNKPHVLLKGTFEERFNLAVKHIDKILKN